MPPQSPSQPPFGAPTPQYPPQDPFHPPGQQVQQLQQPQQVQAGVPQYNPNSQSYAPSYGPPGPQPGSSLPPQQPQPYPGQQPVQQYTPPTNLTSGNASYGVVPPPPPRPETPYDFFMASAPHQRRKGMLFSPASQPGTDGSSQKGLPSKLVLIAGGGVALLVIVATVALFLPKGDPKLELIAAAQSQSETLRICNEGVKQAKLQTTKNFVANCTLSLASEQRMLLAQLSKSGLKVDEKVLAKGRNARFDQQLKSAQSASNFDDTFTTIASSQMNSYVGAMKRAATAPSTTNTEKALLTKQFQSSQLLLQQLKQQNP